MRSHPILIVLSALLGYQTLAVPPKPAISAVSMKPPFFNPSLGQKATIEFRSDRAGTVTLTILDRDRFPIRKLAAQNVAKGKTTLTWDGKDDRGEIVPDEAYLVRIELSSGEAREVYDPAAGFQPVLSEPKRSYSMVSGVLRYELDAPSRVHVQAGEAVLVGDPKDEKRDGPVLKTIVDREPRAAGAVIETWNGYDESCTVYIPSLKNFAISILSESLPPNTLIAVGNRTETFRHYAGVHRNGSRPLYGTAERTSHIPGKHHQGLSALEDYSPALTLTLRGKKDGEGRVEVGSEPLALTVQMSPEDAKYFLRPEGELAIFIDERPLLHESGATNPAALSVSISSVPPGEHRLAVNWISGHGPMAAQVARIIRKDPTKEATK
jgi:hypothetical protein